MKNILFSHSYFLEFDPKQRKSGLPYAPLGTITAAALLREKGFHVSLFDSMFSKDPEEVGEMMDSSSPDIFILYDDGFNYLTKMCLTNMRSAAFRMMEIAKSKGCTVIISSSDATDHHTEYLEKGADFVIIGEGEITALELCENLENKNNSFEHIKGIVFRNKDQLTMTSKRELLKNLDCLPRAAWDLVDVGKYKSLWMKNAGYFSMNIGTTRGCPFKCNWCAKPIYGNRYNVRSPENVIDEIKYLKNTYGVDHIWFCDDIFGLIPGWVSEFALLVKQNGLTFKFKIQSRADLLVKESYIENLKIAGCDNAWMGAESGSQKILDAMDKGITVSQIRKATLLLKQFNIKPSLFIQFGYPGEERQDIDLTIKMINELLPYEIGVSVSYPLPGTFFYQKVKEQLKRKANWTDSDELVLMFSNTYRPAFYKRLHKFVHKNYKKHLAFNKVADIWKDPGSLDWEAVKKIFSFLYYLPLTYLEKRKLDQLEKI